MRGSFGAEEAPACGSPPVCEPSEEVLKERLRKARVAAAKIQAQLSAAENARRKATPDCGRGNHDIEQTLGTVFNVYRCRRCPQEEWL